MGQRSHICVETTEEVGRDTTKGAVLSAKKMGALCPPKLGRNAVQCDDDMPCSALLYLLCPNQPYASLLCPSLPYFTILYPTLPYSALLCPTMILALEIKPV